MKAFNIASLLVLAITVASFILLLVLIARKILRLPNLFLFFSRDSTEKIAVLFSIIGLCIVYIIFLSTNAILGSDVVQFYLPMAREIVRGNGFTYSTGYDYNVILRPIGVSVLYAWTYIVSGSIFSESFRLMPLVPIFMLIILNYAITVSATKSSKIGALSTVIFCVLPFHDRFLLRTAFYPDIFYYPLIFSVIFFLLEYFQSKRSILLLWTGIGFGAASLLKAQTIYFFIAFIIVVLIIELRRYKTLSAALCLFTPFYILVPSIMADSIQRNGILLTLPHLTQIQAGLFLFLSALSGIFYYLTIYKSDSKTKVDGLMIIGWVKKITLLILPFAILASLWYINNLLRFGTLIFTSSINLPNFNWARSITGYLKMPQTIGSMWHYVAYFLFVFIDPAVMGYTMLIPLLIGLFIILKHRSEYFNILLLFEVLSASIILSTVVLSLSTPMPGYNPRDILPLAPLLSTLSAIGIVSITSNFNKKGYDVKSIIVSLLLVAYFGLLNYVHSVYVWYTNLYQVTKIGELMSAFDHIVGLNLRQTSFQLSYGDRAIFVGENILRIVSLSLFAGIPVLVLMIFKMSPKKAGARARSFFTISLMLSVIVIPRVEMLIVQGGPQNIQKSQFRWVYRDVYEFFPSPSEFEGDILTFKAPMGLPYYLPDVKIIDLTWPANLAFLKDCFQSVTPYEAVVKLREQNISYLFINLAITRQLDTALNFTLSKIIQNPEYSSLSRTYGSWKLYNLGPYIVDTFSFPLSGWDIDPRYPVYTNANYNFSYDGSSLFLELESTDTNSRVTIINRDLPKLNLSNYDYITAEIEGSTNSRIVIRFWLNDGKSFDIAYWKDPYMISSTSFDLKPYYGKMLRGYVYIVLKSSDGLNPSIKILEISFIKIKN